MAQSFKPQTFCELRRSSAALQQRVDAREQLAAVRRRGCFREAGEEGGEEGRAPLFHCRGRLWRWPHSRVPFERPGARTARGSGGRLSICRRLNGSTSQSETSLNLTLGRLSICHHRLNGQFEGAGTDWADARLGTEGTGLLAGALARRWQLISAGSSNKHAGGTRCLSLQLGTPACACWLEPESVNRVLDHAQPRTTAQLRSNAA